MTEPSPRERERRQGGVEQDLQRQPHLLARLAENSLLVAESLRDNYFRNTARFLADLRRALSAAAAGRRAEAPLEIHRLEHADWSSFQGEVVTFIDGGVGRVRVGSQAPILLRVGSYSVRTGERQLAKREQFGYYPVILGDLEGGSKERNDFTEIVRIVAELLGGLSALERTQDLRALIFHGPLVYPMGPYAGHTPLTERDIDLLLRHYAPDPQLGRELKEEFLRAARVDIYPAMTDRASEWARERLFEPLAWIAFLLRRLVEEAGKRRPVPVVAGVIERSDAREFSERVLLERIFRSLRARGRENYFNEMFGRTDLESPRALLDRLGYSDGLLLAMLLDPGHYSEPWEMRKYDGLRQMNVAPPHDAALVPVDFAALRPGAIGFPHVRGCYLGVTGTVEPLRIEVLSELGEDQVAEAARRVYLYARLLPGYGFPVGLDIADKYAHVPQWMTAAYDKLIRYHLGVSLQQGEIRDEQMRRILVQAIYMTHRDWLFRPQT